MATRLKMTNPLWALALVAALGVGVSACSSSDSTPAAKKEVSMDDEPTPAELAMAADEALKTAKTAVDAVMNDSNAATVKAADDAVAAARTAVAAASDADNHAALSGRLGELTGSLAEKKSARMTAMNAAMDADTAAMAVTAAKLYAGIAAQNGDVANTTAAGTALAAADERGAAYNNVDVPESGVAVDTRIMVGIGTGTPVALTEDKDTTVAALHGWEGKRYTAEPDDDGMYEAMVYSKGEEPTQGPKFNSGTGADNVGFALDGTTGETPVLSTLTGYAARVGSPSFDQSAGTKEFELATNTVRVMLSGTYHGVSGTYYCTPAADSTCASRKAAEGFELGSTLDADNAFTAGGWTFKPTNPEARVMSAPVANYASYGWWIHKSENGATFTASAFVDNKGTFPAAAALDTLQGTATYMGGAAGKYALSSSTGGTNDAGHFTARAMLEADFSDNSITGTIDNFMGADGMSRDWSVELKEAAIAATGGIARAAENDTVWTIDGTAGDASGEWGGTLYDNGDDGVPQVGTGTFDSTYGLGGKMVGAFGVNKQ